MVDDKYWGIVAFDDCRQVTRRSNAEIAVLKTAAACIGSAIERERLLHGHSYATAVSAKQPSAMCCWSANKRLLNGQNY